MGYPSLQWAIIQPQEGRKYHVTLTQMNLEHRMFSEKKLDLEEPPLPGSVCKSKEAGRGLKLAQDWEKRETGVPP